MPGVPRDSAPAWWRRRASSRRVCPPRCDPAITGIRVTVADAIDAMRLKFWADGPESYSRVLFESYSDPNIGWRSGAKRVMVNFGDDVPHDCNYDAIIGGTHDTGHDPGRD